MRRCGNCRRRTNGARHINLAAAHRWRRRLRARQRQRPVEPAQPAGRARDLQEAGLGTLLIDLLEEHEAGDRAKVFDIALLADRLQAAALWLASQPETAQLPLGYFGASTGAGAALRAAAQAPAPIGAIVSRGGRPDLAGDALPRVTAPSLLIVGGNDDQVLKLNRAGLRHAQVSPAARGHPWCLAPFPRTRGPGGSLAPGPGMVP